MFIKAAPVAAEEERRGSVSNWFSSLRRGGRRKREDNGVPAGYGSLGRRKDGGQSRGKTRSAWDLTTVTRLQLKDELGEVVAELEALDGQEECKQNSKAKQMSIGRKKFNMDPKKGIEYLYENGLLQRTAEDVAQFLHKGEGLSKTAIGDYLGERSEFNEAVLRAFVELHDFTDLILVQALRQFLWSFRLPGEAQKIDRMMESFAQRYCQLNPDIFTNADTCYVLSFAIIMLNTSLHNPSVKDKPTPEQFVAMNRGINNGGDLPQELLLSLYESIKTEPFKIPEDDGNDLMHTFFNPDKEGWLWKQGGRYKSWKRRWFILNDNCLYYFEYTTDKEPRGIIPLENISFYARGLYSTVCVTLYVRCARPATASGRTAWSCTPAAAPTSSRPARRTPRGRWWRGNTPCTACPRPRRRSATSGSSACAAPSATTPSTTCWHRGRRRRSTTYTPAPTSAALHYTVVWIIHIHKAAIVNQRYSIK